jgi:hypothetical protein
MVLSLFVAMIQVRQKRWNYLEEAEADVRQKKSEMEKMS